jgi:PncC family amidohydrolase
MHITESAAADSVLDGMALERARMLVLALGEKQLSLALAESCTAGLAAALIASVPGASRVLWGSFVCYTAQAKAAMLGLDPQRLDQFGLVSGETACDMAKGALEKSGADIAAAVTGLAGPDGDGSDTPVGRVWLASVLQGGSPRAKAYNFSGSRNEIRLKAALVLMEDLLELAEEAPPCQKL